MRSSLLLRKQYHINTFVLRSRDVDAHLVKFLQSDLNVLSRQAQVERILIVFISLLLPFFTILIIPCWMQLLHFTYHLLSWYRWAVCYKLTVFLFACWASFDRCFKFFNSASQLQLIFKSCRSVPTPEQYRIWWLTVYFTVGVIFTL